MSQSSSIEWTDATWNPVRGCSRVSEGCRHCYAERQAARFRDVDQPFHGFVKTHVNGEPRWTGRVELIPSKLDEPLRWRKPRRIFVNSMSDLFHEALSDESIAAVFGVMAAAKQHTFQVLTKRPGRAREWLSRCADGGGLGWITHDGTPPARAYEGTGEIVGRSDRWPLPNVWIGVSVEDQATANERIPHLLATPAAVRFVSYEPALGPVDFRRWTVAKIIGGPGEPTLDGLDWIIVGGESGPGARPFDLAWARSTVEQCREVGVACFVKQIGAQPHVGPDCIRLMLNDRKGGDWSEWPEDLRVREFPGGPA